MPEPKKSSRFNLLRKIACPHCWKMSPPHDIKWVALHPDLRDDAKIPDGMRRFVPTHFTLNGQALDAKGEACNEVACPNCHLVIPRDLVEVAPTFFSMVGAPGSGKSHILASSIWELRKWLARDFRLSFEDSDPIANQKVIEYEEALFNNAKPHELTVLPKTELDGDLYEQVEVEPGRILVLPRAFVYRIRFRQDHARFEAARKKGRAICLYDNAGEHFLPQASAANSPGTRHLLVSRALFFVFDPTQHMQFRMAMAEQRPDENLDHWRISARQDSLLPEVTRRIALETGAHREGDSRPLIVILSKYDEWSELHDYGELKRAHIVRPLTDGGSVLDVERLQLVSASFRKLLERLSPEIVAAAEAFSSDVTYLPCSALGCSPQEIEDGSEGDPSNRALGVRPADIAPAWADIPLLYAMQRTIPGLIPRPAAAGNQADSPPEEVSIEPGPAASTEAPT